MKSDNIASHLYRVRFFYQLPKVHKAAIFVLTLEMRWFNRWVRDLTTFTQLIRDGWLVDLGLSDFPPVTFPCTCLHTSAGAIIVTGAQHSCLPTCNSIRLHLHGLRVTCSSVTVSRDKTYLVSSGSVLSNRLPKLWIHSSLYHMTSPSGIINMTQWKKSGSRS